MITYTIIKDGYVILRDGNNSVTFNENASVLWDEYQKWLGEGNEPLTVETDELVLKD